MGPRAAPRQPTHPHAARLPSQVARAPVQPGAGARVVGRGGHRGKLVVFHARNAARRRERLRGGRQ
eukprot:7383872-Prymnesium_polylepis.1